MCGYNVALYQGRLSILRLGESCPYDTYEVVASFDRFEDAEEFVNENESEYLGRHWTWEDRFE